MVSYILHILKNLLNPLNPGSYATNPTIYRSYSRYRF